MYDKVWSHDSIIHYIQDLEARGKPLYSSYVQENYSTLHRAAFRYFGNWKTAVTLAGFNYDEIRRTKRWTNEKIVAEIKKLYERGEDLSWRVVSMGKHAALASAAICKRHFGSWRNALLAAGIKESEFRRYQRWSEKKIQKVIVCCYQKGDSLNAKAMQKEESKLYHAASRRFGSWRNAVESCGLDYRQIAKRVHLSKVEVLKALDKLKKQGVYLSSCNVQANYPAIHAAAVRRFGSWRSARKQLLGYDYDLRFKKYLEYSRNHHFGAERSMLRESTA